MRWVLILLLASGCGFVPGCTLVKPIVNAVAYAPLKVVERLERTSPDEPDDLPLAVALIAFPVLFPLNYAYWTVHGTVSGVFSGVVSDLNLLTGNGSFDRTWDTMLEPQKTNATPR